MSQNFNYEHGVVGKYKGIRVEVIPQVEYDDMPNPQSTTIYALSTGYNSPLKLVLKDTVIGAMTPTGEITDFDNRVPYLRPSQVAAEEKKKTKKSKKERAAEEKIMEVVPEVHFTSGQIADINLWELSKPIDDYLKVVSKREIYKEILFAEG